MKVLRLERSHRPCPGSLQAARVAQRDVQAGTMQCRVRARHVCVRKKLLNGAGERRVARWRSSLPGHAAVERTAWASQAGDTRRWLQVNPLPRLSTEE